MKVDVDFRMEESSVWCILGSLVIIAATILIFFGLYCDKETAKQYIVAGYSQEQKMGTSGIIWKKGE